MRTRTDSDGTGSSAGAGAARRLAVLGAVLGVASLGAGCDDMENGPVVCDRPATPEPVDYRGGSVESGVYMSSEWDGELLHFPGGAYYRIHHGLGERPRWWQIYLSFERDGVESGSVAQAAGNQAELKGIDEHTITIVNGSCSEYWVLAVAGVGGEPCPADPM